MIKSQRRRFRLGKNREKRQLRIQAQGVLANGKTARNGEFPVCRGSVGRKNDGSTGPRYRRVESVSVQIE